MADDHAPKPDFAAGVPFGSVPDGGILAGTVGQEHVLLTRDGEIVRAFGGLCTHLGAPLEKGLVIDGTIRCPWHHACFSLRSGEAVRAPAFDSLQAWVVERRADLIVVSKRVPQADRGPKHVPFHSEPGLVIIGGGAAGYAAAHEMRRIGHEGPITIVSDEPVEPYDRTLLTKDYLDGTFGDDRLPIAQTSLADLDLTFLRGMRAQSIDRSAGHVHVNGGPTLPYTKLLLATGAEPRRLDVSGADLPHVCLLRSLAQCQTLLGLLRPGATVVVVGSSFIGLEAAASIRSRGHAVTVVTPEAEPMATILGQELSRAIMGVHTEKGVIFRTQAQLEDITQSAVRLKDGSSLPADVVVVGIGVEPRVELAAEAGLGMADGIVVDRHLRTSDPAIYAAGDIACWPDPHSGKRIRVEHWVVAERQGQIAARNMLGGSDSFTAVPFFWSKHFDFSFRYLGHAEQWDAVSIDGDLAARSAVIRYSAAGRDLAVATIEQDVEALRIERRMEGDKRLG